MIEEKSNRATLKQKAQRGKGTEAQSAEVQKIYPLTLPLSHRGRGKNYCMFSSEVRKSENPLNFMNCLFSLIKTLLVNPDSVMSHK